MFPDGCSDAGSFSPWRAGVSQLPRVGVEDLSPTCLGTSSLLTVLGDASLGSSEGERWSLQEAECLPTQPWLLWGLPGMSMCSGCYVGPAPTGGAFLACASFPAWIPPGRAPPCFPKHRRLWWLSCPPGASLPYDFLFGLHLSCMYTADLITCWLQTPHKSEHGHQAATTSFCEYSLVDFICQFPIFQAQFFRSLFSRRHDCSAGQRSCPLL